MHCSFMPKIRFDKNVILTQQPEASQSTALAGLTARYLFRPVPVHIVALDMRRCRTKMNLDVRGFNEHE